MNISTLASHINLMFFAVLLSLYGSAFSVELDDSMNKNFIGVGAGLNPLCLVVSEEHFACATQASIYAAFDAFHLYTKFDSNYIYLPSRRSKTNESNIKTDEWGPRNLFLSSWNIGLYQRFFEDSRLPLTVGFGGGRYSGHNNVQHRIYENSQESTSKIENSTDDFIMQGTVFHAHFAIEPRRFSGMGSSLKFLLNIDGFRPDQTGEDAFSTGTIVTMPTPHVFWGWNF